MIVSVTGLVRRASGTSVVIDVAGIGYLVNCTPAHVLSLRVGESATLHTSQVVREDSLSLYGFATEDEQALFDLLTSVSGVGPKSALGVLSALAPSDIALAVANDDDSVFRAVSGIGPKTAKLITLSLAGKVSVVPSSGSASVAAPATGDAVVAALSGLGWQDKAAQAAVSAALEQADETTAASVPALLRLALAQLGGSR